MFERDVSWDCGYLCNRYLAPKTHILEWVNLYYRFSPQPRLFAKPEDNVAWRIETNGSTNNL